MTTSKGKCCDEGWKLDADGLPLDPAVPCARHPRKTGAAKPGDPTPADAPDLRDGNKNKFAWFYEMLADTNVTTAAKVVGTGCAMKLAGRKGHFKATRKAIANLCGISQATVRRGLADLIDKKYLTADIHEGAASTYYLVPPAQRWEQWLDSEREYEGAVGRWLWAETQFRSRLALAATERQGTESTDQKRADPGTQMSRPRLTDEPTPVRRRADPGSTLSRPRLKPDADTSADDQTHNSFKSLKEPERFLKDLESEPALRGALNARPPHGSAEAPAERNAGTCALCDNDGIFLDRDGRYVVLIDDYGIEYDVYCQHSLAANLTHIQHRENDEGLSLCRTGWPEIDSHYPEFDDEYPWES